MKYIGMLCNCSIPGSAGNSRNPKDELSPSLVNRAFLIDRLLRPNGFALFLYSPRALSEESTLESELPGYTIDGDDLVEANMPVPLVNANWTYGTRKLVNQGMGYRTYQRWMKANEVGVYVPYAFSEIVSNKRKAFDVVSAYDEDLHPRTDDYLGSATQVRSFFEHTNVVFIKPRSGNRGNEIFVLRSQGKSFSLRYYDQGVQRLMSPLTLEAAMGVVEVAAGEKTYIIQQGVDSLRYNDAVFDVRVCTVNDGQAWHSILETRLAPKESDLSNVFQGGSIQVTEDLLEEMFGADKARTLEQYIRDTSHGLAEHLETQFPGELMEIGLDFVLDQDAKLHLVEVNAKPGIAGFGSEAKIFDWKAEDEAYYEKWVYPHVGHLARFLIAKAEQAQLNET